MAPKKQITPDDVADVALSGLSGKATSLITSFFSNIPIIGGIIGPIVGFLVDMFGIDKAIQSSPLVKKFEADARKSIIQAGNDKNSPIGQGFQALNETLATADSKIKSALGVTPDQSTAPAGQQTSADDARAAAERAKPATPVNGGVDTIANQPPNAPAKPATPAPAAGVNK